MPVVTVEDHSVAGGFGSVVLETAQEMGLDTARVVRLGMPVDRFIAHGSRSGQLAECRIDTAGIASTIQELLGMDMHAEKRRVVKPARSVAQAKTRRALLSRRETQ